MIYLIVSIIFLIIIKKWNSITKILFALLAITSGAAYLVGRQYDAFSTTSIIYASYTVLILVILFLSFRKYANLQGIDDSKINIVKLHEIERVLEVIGIITLLINLYILYRIFPLLAAEQINVQEYKNEGGAYDVIDQFVPHIFVTFSNLVSAVGYFFLPMHFYYLYKKQTKKSIFYLLLSLIVILSRMISLSRSSSVEFLIAYALMFLFVSPVLGKKVLRRVTIVVVSFSAIIVLALAVISESRFSGYYTKNSKQEAILDEQQSPVLFSTIDYFTQWEEWGEYVLHRFKPEYSAHGTHGFGGIYKTVEQKIVGPEVVKERQRKLELSRGEGASSFPGLVADLVVDFGFIGAFIFALLFSRLMNSAGPRKGFLPFNTLLYLPIILTVIGLFWAGNVFGSFSIEAGVLYNFIIYQYIKKRPVRKPSMAQAIPSN